jgi:hypothetical protein
MSTKESERDSAIAATERTCPRCGARRDPDQRYCLECGLALPSVEGRLPALRRRWIRRLGWYPGDWIWVSLLTLVVAAVAAAGAIVLSEHRSADQAAVLTATTTGAVAAPVTPVGKPRTTGTSKLPTAPEATTGATGRTGSQSASVSWPARENGWTIVLVSYPKVNGRPTALQTAAKARSSGLRLVGILDSSLYASLQPGYLVVFTGIYGSKSDADAGVPTARQAGFGGAYSRQIAR